MAIRKLVPRMYMYMYVANFSHAQVTSQFERNAFLYHSSIEMHGERVFILMNTVALILHPACMRRRQHRCPRVVSFANSSLIAVKACLWAGSHNQVDFLVSSSILYLIHDLYKLLVMLLVIFPEDQDVIH